MMIKTNVITAVLIVSLVINNVISQRYSMTGFDQPGYQYGSQYGGAVGPQYGGQFGYRATNYQMAGAVTGFGQPINPNDQMDQMDESQMSQKTEYPSKGVLEAAAGFVSKKIRQTITLIKCVLKCFMQRFTVNLCYQMFPCLYDCFIGQEYIPNDIEKQIEDIGNSRGLVFPAAIDLKSIYTMIKCIYDCATERQIRNWESFAYSLYCFADSCICYKIFNTNG